jgi:hypothetical protein
MSTTGIYFDNSGSLTDYIYVTDCDGIHLGTGDYEIEWRQWMEFEVNPANTRSWAIGLWPATLSISIEGDSSTRNIYYFRNNSMETISLATLDAATYSLTWLLFKLKRVGTTLYFYINNSQVYTLSNESYDLTSDVRLYIGCQGNNSGPQGDTTALNGWISSFSWTKAGTQQLLINTTGCSGPIAGNVYFVNSGSATQTFPTLDISTPYKISCFNKGTQILCIVDDKESYIPIENIVAGTMVKTYKHGAKSVKCIGHGQFINDVATPKNCMYKMEKTESMTDDLLLTGGHAILVDEAPKGLKFMIDDKFLSFVENNKSFAQLTNDQPYTYYNFCMEGDSNVRYGVWANGVLCETPSEKQFRTFTYHHIDE